MPTSLRLKRRDTIWEYVRAPMEKVLMIPKVMPVAMIRGTLVEDSIVAMPA